MTGEALHAIKKAYDHKIHDLRGHQGQKDAARNLLACSRVAAKMALERRESRGLHLRDDYSYIDNENWQVRQLAELVNGEDKLSKKVPVVTRIPLRKAEKIDYESFILEEDLGMKNMEES